MNYLTKTAPIGREATLERIIATAEKMGDRDLAAPEIAELDRGCRNAARISNMRTFSHAGGANFSRTGRNCRCRRC